MPRVAEALGKLLGRSVTADQLPVERLIFDEDAGAVVLHGRDKAWRLDLSGYELRETDAAGTAAESLPTGRRPRPTSRTGPETSITFVNQTPEEIVVYWIDMDGQRRRYAAVGPGDQHRQHTYAGHVWLVTGQAGATLGVFEAAEEESRAVVEAGGATAAKQESRPPERASQRQGRRSPESPDGKWLVILQDHNLRLRVKDTGEEFALSADGHAGDRYSLGDLWWSPDSQKLVALRTEPAQEHPVQIIESSPADQLQPKLRTFDYLKPGDRIAHPRPQLFHVATRRQVEIRDELFANPWSIEDIRWSADSRGSRSSTTSGATRCCGSSPSMRPAGPLARSSRSRARRSSAIPASSSATGSATTNWFGCPSGTAGIISGCTTRRPGK